jgi:hypothetical protein
MSLAATNETVEFRINGYPGNFIQLPDALEHADMPLMICAAFTRLLIFHDYYPFLILK